MARRPQPSPSRSVPSPAVPADLRARLERARLDLRALFRALDQVFLAQDLPDELHALLELDADFAEALWALDQPRGRFDLAAMTRDTLASLAGVANAREEFLGCLDADEQRRLAARLAVVRLTLRPDDAYLEIPGRDPQTG